MINLLQNGVTCDCGESRLAPAVVLIGEPCICAACAKTFRVEVSLTPIPWSVVELELGAREHDLCAFTWHRNGVPPAYRRTLPELQARRSLHTDRMGAVGGLLVLVVLVLIVRAVLS